MRNSRGVTPAIGVVMMVVLTVLLASVVGASVTMYGADLDADEAVPTASSAESTATETAGEDRWFGDTGDLFRLSKTEAGATNVSVRVNFTVESGSGTIGNSLNSVYIEVTTGSPDVFSGTEHTDLERIAVDTDGDGSVEEDISGDVDGWTVENDGAALKIGLSGSAYTPDAGDSILVTFGGVTNPSDPGTYDMQAQTSGDGNWHYGNVSVTD